MWPLVPPPNVWVSGRHILDFGHHFSSASLGYIHVANKRRLVDRLEELEIFCATPLEDTVPTHHRLIFLYYSFTHRLVHFFLFTSLFRG
mgnify:CR=1 FL=1